MIIIQREASIGRCISILYRHAQAHISKQLHPYNIGSGQYSLLLILSTNNGAMQETLSCELQMDKANVARAVTKLEKEGYVRRESDAEDKRVCRIFLTDRGLEILPTIRGVLSDWNKLISSGLDKSEEAIVANLLQKMATNAGFKWHGGS